VRIANRFPMVSGHSMSEHDVSNGPGNDVYFKGSHILHTLRGQIGDAAFFKAVRLLVYGRVDPKPGNFAPRYSTTKEFIQIVNQVTGKDWNWFFNTYLRHAALPELLQERRGNVLHLRWKTPDNSVFPLPIEVRVNQKLHQLDMKNGVGQLVLPANAIWTVDPASKVLKHEPQLLEWERDVAQRSQATKK